jgi:succinate dehydrogenase/fumarate reductase flavoprotein subunit
VDFRSETVICKLLSNHGRIVGALGISLATGDYMVFNAKVTVLSTGGLGALYKVTTNSRILTGDGYAMAWDAGAELVDMEMVQFLPLAFHIEVSAGAQHRNVFSFWPRREALQRAGRKVYGEV